MKNPGRIIGLLVLAGIIFVAVRTLRKNRDKGTSPTSLGSGTGAGSGQKRSISRELLEILADPADKGPVELLEVDGKEWLVNRRNGYRYPVEDGIPIMLIEEGEKYKDERLITKSS
jgi:uncharacterized protein YbaR (Trm112 family)